MTIQTYWSPNQAAIAQVETYTFSAPNGVGNTYTATLNGKSITYTSINGDTATTVATGLFNLLTANSSIAEEFTEISFSNSTSATIVATANTPGTPFANVPGTTAGLVMSTGGGLSNGIATVHTQANQSPSDVNDPQNWLRINTGVGPPPIKTRALPQNGDTVIVEGTSTPMLWNLDQLASVQFGSYQRLQSMTGQIGLPQSNSNGYEEWRACNFKFVGPQGSVPAGGLQMVLGQGSGGGPSFESYDVGSQQTTLTIINGNTVNFIGVHTQNTFSLLGGVTLNIAVNPGEVANLNSSTIDGSGTLNAGPAVTWTNGSTLTMYGGSAVLNTAPPTLTMTNGAQVAITTDLLTWPAITMQNGSLLTWFAGGIVTNLTMTTSSSVDKSQDARTLTITNGTIDGDSCQINDPLNAIVYTNGISVKQQVNSGPFLFTGTRTVKVI